MKPYIAEFVGTLILVLLGDGSVAAVLLRKSKAEHSGWIVITFGWAMAVALAVYAVGPISGAHINPAVTIGLAAIGAFNPDNFYGWGAVPGYIIAQMLGAFVGAVLVWLTYRDHWKETDDPVLKLGSFCTIPEIRNTVSNFITEVIATAMLLFGVVAIVTNAQTFGGANLAVSFSTGIIPLIIGFIVFAIGLSLGGPTGYAINPARDLAPRIAHAVLPVAAGRAIRSGRTAGYRSSHRSSAGLSGPFCTTSSGLEANGLVCSRVMVGGQRVVLLDSTSFTL